MKPATIDRSIVRNRNLAAATLPYKPLPKDGAEWVIGGRAPKPEAQKGPAA